MIVLVGFMGAGKTAVGRALAQKMNLPFVDLDAEIERVAGTSIREIFEDHGEESFRETERQALAHVLSGPGAVIAAGGGVVVDESNRAALQDATVVFLDAPLEDLLGRIGNDADRPMLARSDPTALYERRRPFYEEAAGVVVETSGRSIDEVVAEIMRSVGVERPRVTDRRVRVEVPMAPYDAVIGRGTCARLAVVADALNHAENVFVVTDADLEDLARQSMASLEELPASMHRIVLGPGEQSKTLATAEQIYDRLASSGAHRHDVVVAFGGGVVTDVAGFVASTFNRGLPLVNVPTTLLGQVDAAIGGKTGVNLRQGKNLVGTIYQPAAVVCDIHFLATQPRSEIASGLAEVVKYGFIRDASLLDLVENKATDLLAADAALLTDVVERCVRIKAEVVGRDEREAGERAHLNYGHTFAHAFERLAGYGDLRHGEAVAIGMMAAAHLASVLGMIDDDVVEQHRRVLAAVGLPVSIDVDVRELEEAWRHDKKYDRGVRFVLLETRDGRTTVRTGVFATQDALDQVGERLAQ
ncbi:MAG: 3-dehydroquinate synthase [Actinomycetota bacterium]|nr:3-dehydroquinate synthase [Actinomycetota bacterium]